MEILEKKIYPKYFDILIHCASESAEFDVTTKELLDSNKSTALYLFNYAKSNWSKKNNIYIFYGNIRKN